MSHLSKESVRAAMKNAADEPVKPYFCILSTPELLFCRRNTPPFHMQIKPDGEYLYNMKIVVVDRPYPY